MKKVLLLLFVMFSCLLFLSCAKNNDSAEIDTTLDDSGLLLIPQETILYKQNPTVGEEVLDDLREQQMDLISFCEMHNISGYKIVNNAPYLVINTDQAIYHVVFSSDLARATIEEVRFSASAHKADVEKLVVGMTLQDGRAADPDGQYTVNNRWKAHFEDGFSYHYFEDGDCFFILYDSGVISTIIPFTI